MPGYSENCVSGGGEIIVYKSPTYSKCLLLAQYSKHVTKCDLYSFCSINDYSMVTLDIDTLFLTAIILNFSSFHDFSLTAAWAGRAADGRPKQL